MAWYLPPSPERAILAYGDSQGEVLDYVFHGNEEYVRYAEDPRVGWRSGWSTRGLGKTEHVARFIEPLSELDGSTKHAFYFLSYGSVDIEWNLSYKRDVLKQNVDTKAFIGEMVDELASCVDRIVSKGKEFRARPCGGPQVHVTLCVPFVPLPLSENYLEEFDRKYGGGSYRVIEHEERVALWNQFCDAAQARICAAHPRVQIVDVREDFAARGFPAFMLDDEEDHHPDLAKSQHAVAARVEKLVFTAEDGESLTLEPKLWPHTAMYPHVKRRFTNTPSPQPSPTSSPLPAPVVAPPPQPTSALDKGTALDAFQLPAPATTLTRERSLSSDSIIELPEIWQHKQFPPTGVESQATRSQATKQIFKVSVAAGPARTPLSPVVNGP